MGLNEVLQDYVNLSYGELLSVAAHAAKTVIPFFNSAVEDGDGAIFTISFIGVSLASDGQLTEGEWKFIASFIGRYSYNEALALAGEFYSSEAQEVVKKFIQSFPSEVRDAYIKMCIAVMCVDKRINNGEASFLDWAI